MKMPQLAVGGLVVGLVGGALISGLGAKAQIVEERAQAKADSLAALDHAEAATEGHESVTVELPEDPPAVVDPPAEGEPPAHPEDTTTGTPPTETMEAVDSTAGPAEGEDPVGTPTAPFNPGDPGLAGAMPPAEGTPPVDVLNDEGSRKLAKIFAAMDAEDAAAVLVEMTDEEVTAILVRMSDRKAAPVIASFPPERAALLTQNVLHSSPGGQG